MVPVQGRKLFFGSSALMRHWIAWPCSVTSSCVNVKRHACRDGDLIAHDVDRRDLFGHRMLDLQAGVHFNEVEPAVLVQEELDGAGIVVVDGLGDRDGRFAHFFAKIRRQISEGAISMSF